jgi:hypothetical protein
MTTKKTMKKTMKKTTKKAPTLAELNVEVDKLKLAIAAGSIARLEALENRFDELAKRVNACVGGFEECVKSIKILTDGHELMKGAIAELAHAVATVQAAGSLAAVGATVERAAPEDAPADLVARFPAAAPAAPAAAPSGAAEKRVLDESRSRRLAARRTNHHNR